MSDLFADIRMRPRYIGRTMNAFARALKSLTGDSSRSMSFNIPGMLRLHDMNPLIYVSALLLLDADVPQDPQIIRDHEIFSTLIDRLGIQPSSSKRDVKNTHRASLILLEVFTYMVVISIKISEAEKSKIDNSGKMYEQEELTL